MKREKVKQIIESARAKGERPNLSGHDLSYTNLSELDLRGVILTGPLDNLIGADLCGADLSGADLSSTALQEDPLAGIYPSGTEPAPLPDRRINGETKFPEGFNRYGEMEKED
jgi:uncharacterized protein YjbI with pentapeptide repeats